MKLSNRKLWLLTFNGLTLSQASFAACLMWSFYTNRVIPDNFFIKLASVLQIIPYALAAIAFYNIGNKTMFQKIIMTLVFVVFLLSLLFDIFVTTVLIDMRGID